MRNTIPITAEQLTGLLGDIDPSIAARLLELEPTFDEVGEALAEFEAEAVHGDLPREPSSPKVYAVLRILEDLLWIEAEPAAGYDYAAPV